MTYCSEDPLKRELSFRLFRCALLNVVSTTQTHSQAMLTINYICPRHPDSLFTFTEDEVLYGCHLIHPSLTPPLRLSGTHLRLISFLSPSLLR